MRRMEDFRRLLGLAAAFAVLAGSLAAFPVLSTALGSFLGKAAAASAMLQLPEGGISYLRERFADQLVQDEPVSLPEVSAPPVSSVPAEEPPAEQSRTESRPEVSAAIPQTPESPSIETIAPQNRGTITEKMFSADTGNGGLPFL